MWHACCVVRLTERLPGSRALWGSTIEKAESTMDIYRQASTAKHTIQVQPLQVVDFRKIEFGPVGCWACTSGDSPIFDFEQQILNGF